MDGALPTKNDVHGPFCRLIDEGRAASNKGESPDLRKIPDGTSCLQVSDAPSRVSSLPSLLSLSLLLFLHSFSS